MTTQTADRVRAHTAPEINRRLDEETAKRVEQYARCSVEDITRRIEELDREWDTERVLEMNASALAFTGLLLGITRHKKWFIVPYRSAVSISACHPGMVPTASDPASFGRA